MSDYSLNDIFLKFAAVENKGITFIKSSHHEVYKSYKSIYRNTMKLCDKLRKSGITKADKLIFQINDNEQFVYAFWACIHLGIVPIPLEPVSNKESINKLCTVHSKLNRPPILATEKCAKKIHEIMELSGIEEYVLDMEKLEDNQDIFVNTYDNNDSDNRTTAFIQFSSGSTSEPKGVVLTHKNILENIRSIHQAIEVVDSDISLSWLPLTHDMGLIGFHLGPACKCINHILINTSLFIIRPTIWLDTIHRFNTTITVSPNFGYKYLLNYLSRKKITSLPDLSSLRLIFNGAEPISIDIIKRFIEALKPYNIPENVIFPVYGLAEATLAVTFPKINTPVKELIISRDKLNLGSKIEIEETGYSVVCLGEPVNGCDVIIKNNNEILSEGHIGHIYIKGKNVTSGYYNESSMNDQVFDDENYLYTGDLGFIYDNQLYVTGREGNLIISNGKNYYCEDIEKLLEKNLSDMSRFTVVAVRNLDEDKDKILVFIKTREDKKIIYNRFENLRKQIFMESSILIDGVVIVRKIPLTTSGKIKRYQLAEDFLRGKYDDNTLWFGWNNKDIGSMTEIQSNLTQIFGEIYDIEFHLDDNVLKLCNESILHFQAALMIEEIYDVEIKFEDFQYYQTIREIAAYISENTDRQNGIMNSMSL